MPPARPHRKVGCLPLVLHRKVGCLPLVLPLVCQPKSALVVSKPISEGKYAGQSFVFHMARAVRGGDAWRIHEVSLVRPADLKAQIEAFRAKPVDRPAGPRGFGPTFERVLSRDDTHTESLDLGTNRVIRVPKGLGTNRDITQAPLKWTAVRGIDISLRHNSNRESELTGLSGIFAGTRRVESSFWDASHPDEVHKLLGTDRKFGSWQTPEGEYPMTYLFETMGHPTGTPRQGVLQLLAVDREKQRVTVRYKLVGDPAGDKAADELETPVPVTESTGETFSKSADDAHFKSLPAAKMPLGSSMDGRATVDTAKLQDVRTLSDLRQCKELKVDTTPWRVRIGLGDGGAEAGPWKIVYCLQVTT